MKSTELEKLYNNPNLPQSINDCIKNAERFSEIKFINSIKNHII